MMTVTARPPLNRSDRYVRQAVLQLGVGVSQTRTIFSVEEALRLTALPGENEGRIYFIRRLSLQGLPADCARQVWLDRFQKAIAEAGAEPVHASRPHADSAPVVYFVSHEEACEMLLARLVANQPVREWFWPLVLGDRRVSDRSGQILGVIERLCRTPAGWAAVAETVCSALAERDPIPLLEALPGVALRAWLRELGGPPSGTAFERPVTLPSWLKSLLASATARYGGEDSRAVWLAALAVIHTNPAEAATGRAVARAAATLRWVQRSGHAPDEGAADSDAAPEAAAPASVPRSLASLAASDREHARSDGMAADSSPTAARSRSRRVRIAENEFTEAGGLYFLLNAMRCLGIENAFAAVPELAESAFLPRLFDALAGHAGVAHGDPARRWIDSALEAAASIDFPQSGVLWPSTFRPVRPQCDVDSLVRVWALSARRWCWRAGRVRLPEVVRRPARISLTRTHLDVTFALDRADLRIRRIGLDLDPGWLPWFGRVVQFHYTDSDPGADS